jgi:hypothetical protein
MFGKGFGETSFYHPLQGLDNAKPGPDMEEGSPMSEVKMRRRCKFMKFSVSVANVASFAAYSLLLILATAKYIRNDHTSGIRYIDGVCIAPSFLYISGLTDRPIIISPRQQTPVLRAAGFSTRREPFKSQVLCRPQSRN